MATVPLTVLLSGRPGAGKSTHADHVVEYLATADSKAVQYIQWAKIRDAFIQAHPASAAALADLYAKGKLFPKFLSVSMWGTYMLEHLNDDDHVVMEGVLRQSFEAEALLSALEFFERTNAIILNLEVSPETSSRRLKERFIKENRPDDASEESIANRLAWYETETVAAFNQLLDASNCTIVSVDAERPIEEIQAEIEGIINERLKD